MAAEAPFPDDGEVNFFLDVSGSAKPTTPEPEAGPSPGAAGAELFPLPLPNYAQAPECPSVLYESIHDDSHSILGQTPTIPSSSSNSNSATTCFNCDEIGHTVKDCKQWKNLSKIRQQSRSRQVSSRTYQKLRYHAPQTLFTDSFVPGIISPELRAALGLRHYELPKHIYKMRVYGYPPGWKIQLFQEQLNEGLKMFDDGLSTRSPFCKDKTISLTGMISYPGFTDLIPDQFIDEFWRFNVPPFDPNFKSHLLQKFTWEFYLLRTESETEEEAQERWSPEGASKRKLSGDPDHSDEIENSSSKRICLRANNDETTLHFLESIPKVVMLKDLDFKHTSDMNLFDGFFRNSVTQLPDLEKFNNGMEPLLLVPESKGKGQFKRILETIEHNDKDKPKGRYFENSARS